MKRYSQPKSVYVISGMTHEMPMAFGIYRVSERVWYLIASILMAIELLLLCLSFSLRGWLQIAAVAIHNFSNALWCWNYPRLFSSVISCFSILFLIFDFEIAFWTVSHVFKGYYLSTDTIYRFICLPS